ncbi:MAG: DUF2914 domain-containing protein [Elusimicrobia bacterium]|nr:DUF2914 domain-containing protein [Elusimicrobiota bacterium]
MARVAAAAQALQEPLPPDAPAARRALARVYRHRNVLSFAAGFAVDLLTLDRIDAWLDLATQGLYLAGVTALVLLQAAEEEGRWKPEGRFAGAWPYATEALHFFYGGLLSAYVIFYNKSGTLSHSGIFVASVAALMVANEMPQVRSGGTRLRLGLHSFCVASYLNYLLPVLIGRMGTWVFVLALALAGLMSWALVRRLAAPDGGPGRTRLELAWPPAAVLVLLAAAYGLRWIPPVPLSLKYAGIFHAVERDGEKFRLRYRRPPWYRFWAGDDRRFLARDGDRLHCFVRVFAPTRFTHNVFLHWMRFDPASRTYRTSDRIALPIVGGRDEGFRGFATKANFVEGRWRVAVETEEGRVIGERGFVVLRDEGQEPPDWKERSM